MQQYYGCSSERFGFQTKSTSILCADAAAEGKVVIGVEHMYNTDVLQL